MDFNLITRKHVSGRFFFSNIEPMLYDVPLPDSKSVYDLLKKYKLELFGYPGGIPASGHGKPTEQQWDFPNVWAPHQHILVNFLISIDERDMALHVSRSFFRSVNEGYKKDGDFYEKYNCKTPGFTGKGGEYEPQTGFGWTNGTALSFIYEFGDDLVYGPDHTESYKRILEILEERTGRDRLNEQKGSKNMPVSLMEVIPAK